VDKVNVTTRLVSRPDGAEIYQRKAVKSRHVDDKVGESPLEVTRTYTTESRTNIWWLPTVILSGAALFGGEIWALTTEDTAGWVTMGVGGASLLVFGLSALGFDEWPVVYSSKEDVPNETFVAKKPGFEEQEFRFAFRPGLAAEHTFYLPKAWYTRYGLESAASLKYPESIPKLILALVDEERAVRLKSVAALSSMGVADKRIQRAFEQLAQDGSDPEVQTAAKKALKQMTFASIAGEEGSIVGTGCILAVFDVRDSTGTLNKKALVQLTTGLTTSLVEAARVKVVPRDKLRSRLKKEKGKSHGVCYDERCQIELGKALAAEKVISAQVLRMGKQCAVSGNVYDLATETVERGVIEPCGCELGDLLAVMKTVASKLVNTKQQRATLPPHRAGVPQSVLREEAGCQGCR